MLVLFSFSCHFSSISPGRNLSSGCSCARSISTRVVLNREALKIPHTHTKEGSHSVNLGWDGCWQLSPSSCSSASGGAQHPWDTLPAACLLHSFTNILIILQAGAQNTLKAGGIKAGQGEKGAQAMELCLGNHDDDSICTTLPSQASFSTQNFPFSLSNFSLKAVSWSPGWKGLTGIHALLPLS